MSLKCSLLGIKTLGLGGCIVLIRFGLFFENSANAISQWPDEDDINL
jgi:hypothetical protein